MWGKEEGIELEKKARKRETDTHTPLSLTHEYIHTQHPHQRHLTNFGHTVIACLAHHFKLLPARQVGGHLRPLVITDDDDFILEVLETSLDRGGADGLVGLFELVGVEVLGEEFMLISL